MAGVLGGEQTPSSDLIQNLEDQEYEMTALAEIIGDPQMFSKIDLDIKINEKLDRLELDYAWCKNVEQIEEYFTLTFFNDLMQAQATSNNDGLNCDISKTNKTFYRHAGVIRVCTEQIDLSENISVECRVKLADKRNTVDRDDNLLCDKSISNQNNINLNEKLHGFQVKYLPPIVLNFALPETYPSNCPPAISLYCTWLNKEQVKRLTNKMMEMWNESVGCEVLFTWKSFLQDESINFLDVFQKNYSNTPMHQSCDVGSSCTRILDISCSVEEGLQRLPKHPISSHTIATDSSSDSIKNKSTASQSTPIKTSLNILSSTELKQTIKLDSNTLSSEKINNDKDPKSQDHTRRKNLEKPPNASRVDLNSSHDSHQNVKYYGIVDRYFPDKGFGFIRVFGDGLTKSTTEPKNAQSPDTIHSKSDTDITTGTDAKKSKEPKNSHDKFWWDVYFHRTGLLDSNLVIKKGNGVEFELVDDDRSNSKPKKDRFSTEKHAQTHHKKRTKAINVKLIENGLQQIQNSNLQEPGQLEDHAPQNISINASKKNIRPKNPSDVCLLSDNLETSLNIRRKKFDRSRTGEKASCTASSLSELQSIASSQCQNDLEDTTNRKNHYENGIQFIDLMIKYIKDFDELREEHHFRNNAFLCLVCFVEKLGDQCMRFPICSHVYCCECMKEYFKVQIGEGMMNNLICPNEGCESKALPTQIRKLVSVSQYEMYEKQLLSTTLETMSDIELCPRLNCQCPTIVDRDRSMGHCPNCEYAFCIYCRCAYHGLNACRIDSKEKRQLLEDYMSGDEDKRAELEKRYGKRKLQNLVSILMDDQYMKSNTKKCPSCNACIQKSEGCNKMTCLKCNTYFCYLCESPLSKVNPYGHYSNPESKCYNQLFEGAHQGDFVDNGDADDNGDIRFIANEDDFSSDEEFIVVEDEDGLLRLL